MVGLIGGGASRCRKTPQKVMVGVESSEQNYLTDSQCLCHKLITKAMVQRSKADWRLVGGRPKVAAALRMKIPSNVGEIPIRWKGMLVLTWHA